MLSINKRFSLIKYFEPVKLRLVHLFVGCEGEGCGEDSLKVLEYLVEVADGRLEDREEVGQTEVGHLVHVGVHIHLKGAHSQG